MNRIYTFKVDEKLDQELAKFERKLVEGERIVEQTTVKNNDGSSKLIITTEQDRKGKNLLFDQVRDGNMKNHFGQHGQKPYRHTHPPDSPKCCQ